jgi:hypothetical protein
MFLIGSYIFPTSSKLILAHMQLFSAYMGHLKLHVTSVFILFVCLGGSLMLVSPQEEITQSNVPNTCIRINCFCIKLAIRKCVYQQVK